jgi:hypothetical protein
MSQLPPPFANPQACRGVLPRTRLLLQQEMTPLAFEADEDVIAGRRHGAGVRARISDCEIAKPGIVLGGCSFSVPEPCQSHRLVLGFMIVDGTVSLYFWWATSALSLQSHSEWSSETRSHLAQSFVRVSFGWTSRRRQPADRRGPLWSRTRGGRRLLALMR